MLFSNPKNEQSVNTSTSDKTKVLVIEDSLICQVLYKANLSPLNYHVEIAETAHSALNFVHNKKYDCIILDLGLPDKSGIEVLTLIRVSSLNGNTPVIVISAHVNATFKKTSFRVRR